MSVPLLDEEKNRYQKRIEELIEDAEIEAEIETEKKIRSKNTKLFLISFIGIVLLVCLFFWMRSDDGLEISTVGTEPPFVESLETPKELLEPSQPKPIPVPLKNKISEKLPDQKPEILQAKKTSKEKNFSEKPPIVKIAKKEIKPAPKVTKKVVKKVTKKESIVRELPKIRKVSLGSSPVQRKSAPVTRKRVALPPTVKNSNGRGYFIQIGAFSQQSNAEKLVKKLKKNGLNPMTHVRKSSKLKHVVFVGAYLDQQSGQSQMRALKNSGFNPRFETLGNGVYTLVVARTSSEKQAEQMKDNLSIKGFLSSSKKMSVESKTHIVQIGKFDTKKKARQTQKKLTKLGLGKSFIKVSG
ncbi:MAG: SPOR domain-containing protein [Nitrospinales bacterium]